MPDPELLREWHPLDHTPAPEYVPLAWDGRHVGKRLAEGLRTLRYMPVNGVSAGFVNAWPTILHEYSDRTAYEDDPIWKPSVPQIPIGQSRGHGGLARPRPGHRACRAQAPASGSARAAMEWRGPST
jgi:hypothetical protein